MVSTQELAVKPGGVAQTGILLAQPHQPRDKIRELGVCCTPVQPGDGIVLAVRVVVSLLAVA